MTGDVCYEAVIQNWLSGVKSTRHLRFTQDADIVPVPSQKYDFMLLSLVWAVN